MSFEGAPDITARSWFGQPRGLSVLFLTEMWEKFSFYGMRAMLVYYMTRQLMLGQQHASLVYGLYTGFVFFTPIIGGAIADRWLGKRKAVILGGSIMALGHFMMTFEPLLYPALAAIAIGNGFFLPSLPSQIGGLYAPDDPRRGSAYNVYYVGVNLGAFLAPLVCGTLGETLGWHYGFAAAGIGMLAGLAVYILGGRYLPPEPPRRAAEPAKQRAAGGLRWVWLLLGVGLTVVVFRSAYEQMGNTLALWADEGISRAVAPGLTIPMTWFQSLNPLLVFLLTPVLVALWTRRAAKGREPGDLMKMATGAAVVGAAYLMLAAVAAVNGGEKASWLWLVLFFVLYTLGELYILPVGLGLFARSAPAGHGATTIAAWFFAAFAGNLLAGLLGSLWSVAGPPRFFTLMAAILLGAALLLRILDVAVARKAAGTG
ncbi:MAG TPA: peptide MFS transporter [Caulobacteraceae bacterium]|jgi:POT family proton-dependent oligopeptide transporter